MITSKIELIKITATEGMTLTNGEVFSKEVYLGKNDTADNWVEVADAEAEEMISKVNHKAEEER